MRLLISLNEFRLIPTFLAPQIGRQFLRDDWSGGLVSLPTDRRLTGSFSDLAGVSHLDHCCKVQQKAVGNKPITRA